MEAGKLPKTLRRFAAKLDDFEISSDDGTYWCYYVPGLKSGGDIMGCQHQDHVDTITECATSIRYAIPCDCEECLGMIAKRAKKTETK